MQGLIYPLPSPYFVSQACCFPWVRRLAGRQAGGKPKSTLLDKAERELEKKRDRRWAEGQPEDAFELKWRHEPKQSNQLQRR